MKTDAVNDVGLGELPELCEAGVILPKRLVRWPHTISDQARRILIALYEQSIEAARLARRNPDLHDTPGWKRQIEEMNMLLSRNYTQEVDASVQVSTAKLDGITMYQARPEHLSPSDRRIYISIHGGALIYGSGEYNRSVVAKDALDYGVEVIGLDYRTPPDHPYPAALDDCVLAYQYALRDRSPGQIAVGGSSAGGNLAASLMLRLRQADLPMPAALVLLSPEVDLTESGDSFETNSGLDPALSKIPEINALYANGHALDDPFLSPLFGDLSGFSPTFVQSGTRDLFLSNAARMHRHLRRAGVPAELHIFESMPHVPFIGAPENAELTAEVRRFLDENWR